MNKEETLKCLDMLALALTSHDHQWTEEQRSAYERCANDLAKSSHGTCGYAAHIERALQSIDDRLQRIERSAASEHSSGVKVAACS